MAYKYREYLCDCGELFEELVEEPVPETLPCKKCTKEATKVLSATPGKVTWASVDRY